jgi:hypothetical protein
MGWEMAVASKKMDPMVKDSENEASSSLASAWIGVSDGFIILRGRLTGRTTEMQVASKAWTKETVFITRSIPKLRQRLRSVLESIWDSGLDSVCWGRIGRKPSSTSWDNFSAMVEDTVDRR